MRTQPDVRRTTRGREAADAAKLSIVRPCNIVSHADPTRLLRPRCSCGTRIGILPALSAASRSEGSRLLASPLAATPLIDTHVEQKTCLTPRESATSPKFDRYTFAPFCPAFPHSTVMISFPAMPCNIRYIAHRPRKSLDTLPAQTLPISRHPCRDIFRVNPIPSTKRPKSLGTFSCHPGPGNLPVELLANGRLTPRHTLTPVSGYLKFGGRGRKFGELTWPAAGYGSGGFREIPRCQFPSIIAYLFTTARTAMQGELCISPSKEELWRQQR